MNKCSDQACDNAVMKKQPSIFRKKGLKEKSLLKSSLFKKEKKTADFVQRFYKLSIISTV